MGCGHSKDHPKNADLVKLKKKYDSEPVKKAKLLNIWVIGGNKPRTLDMAKLISEKLDYLLVTEDSLLQTEMDGESERGKIIKEIVQDKGNICPGIVLDLVIELILAQLDGTKGLVFHGIPRDREQAWHLQKLVKMLVEGLTILRYHKIGPVSLVVYCELKGDDLRAALTQDGDELSAIKTKVEHFQKSVSQLSKHKTTLKVDGNSEPESLIQEIVDKVNEISK